MSVISINPEYSLSVRAIHILFNFLKNGNIVMELGNIDPKVFRRFKPNQMIVQNMGMETYIQSENS